MTKKDYQALARAIHEARAVAGGMNVIMDMARSITSNIADVLQADSTRFDRARFVEACETGRCKGMPRKRKTSASEHYVECGSCGQYHREAFAGDCRDDSERFAFHELPSMAQVTDLEPE